MLTVKVGKLPGTMREVNLEDNGTVVDALGHAEMDAQGYEVKLNGSTVVDMGTRLRHGDSVILVKKIKGN
jgi:sulfur carrier protein ThiS